MSDLVIKCSVCYALIDEEDFFCANCGAEAPKRDDQEQDRTQKLTHSFDCQGCGASMSYDANVESLRCPFCGSTTLADKPNVVAIAPRRVVPFAIDHESALTGLRRWLGKGFWRPSDLSDRAAVTAMTAVFVPYWIFEARTFTYWTADTSQTPPGARGDWYPMTGSHRGHYHGHMVGASGVLTPGETAQLCPFDLATAVPPEQISLEEVVVEQFRVQRKYARPLARQGVEALEREACEKYVPGRSRNLKVNVRLEGMSSEPVLLPVWIMAYRYQDRVYRFLLNGQSGQASGSAPVSWKKQVLVIGGVILLILVALLCAGVLSQG